LSRLQSILGALERAGRAAEDTVLVIILTGMIFLAAGQIVLRNVFNTGFFWGDELLRMLVLWIAVAGAVAASRADKHINIAILNRFLPDGLNAFFKLLIDLFTAGICAVVAWFSVNFVRLSWEYEDVLLGQFPAWILQLVLPVGFGLISYRYVIHALKGLTGLLRGDAAE
jgi:TRAP-type C4-dicarboxylate transport system permease small subunit